MPISWKVDVCVCEHASCNKDCIVCYLNDIIYLVSAYCVCGNDGKWDSPDLSDVCHSKHYTYKTC